MSPYQSRRVISREELEELRRQVKIDAEDFELWRIDRKVADSTYQAVDEFPTRRFFKSRSRATA